MDNNVIFRLGTILMLIVCCMEFVYGYSTCGTFQLAANQQVTVTSPGYSNNYAPGSSCMQVITAPQGFYIHASCQINIYQAPGGQCTTERFYISRTYVSSLGSAPYTCGSGTMTQQSSFNQMVLGYSSTSSSTGRYTCTLTAVCDCGWYASQKIVGGHAAYTNEYPSYVAIINLSASNPVHCGGVIISSWWVLTAAHCTLDEMSNTSNMLLWAGGQNTANTNSTGTSQTFGVSQIIRHPSYVRNNEAQTNDIALIRTNREIIFNRGVGPACLATSYALTAFDSTNVDLVGFGTTQFSGPPSQTLLTTTVNTSPNTQCRNQGWPGIIDGQICTYAQGRDACQYDSGGPVYYMGAKQIVIGIINQGKGCATNYPAVNARIAYYLPWIRSVTGAYFCPNT